VQLLRSASQVVDLALVASLTLPTSSSDDYMGESGSPSRPRSRCPGAGALRLAGNLGFRLRSRSELANLTVNDEFLIRAPAPATACPSAAARRWSST
jgi:hypothetical protein